MNERAESIRICSITFYVFVYFTPRHLAEPWLRGWAGCSALQVNVIHKLRHQVCQLNPISCSIQKKKFAVRILSPGIMLGRESGYTNMNSVQLSP